MASPHGYIVNGNQYTIRYILDTLGVFYEASLVRVDFERRPSPTNAAGWLIATVALGLSPHRNPNLVLKRLNALHILVVASYVYNFMYL